MSNTDSIQESFIAALLGSTEGDAALLENAPINTQTLSSLLGSLEQQHNALQQTLVATVRANFDNFLASYTQSQQLHDRVISLVEQSESFQQQALDGDNNVQNAVTKVLQEYHAASVAVADNQREMDALAKIANLAEMVDDIELKLHDGALKEATALLLQLENARLAINKEWPDAVCMSHFSSSQERLRHSLVLLLEETLRNAVVCEDNNTTPSLRVTYTCNLGHGKRITLTEIFDCFSQLEMLPAQMMTLKRLITRHIFTPFFEHPTPVQVEATVVPSDVGDAGILTITHLPPSQDDDPENAQRDPLTLMADVDTILAFLSCHMFGNNEKAWGQAHLFGNLILPDVFQKLIQYAIAPAVPMFSTFLDDFDKVAQAAKQLENQCQSAWYFLTVDDQNGGILSKYVNDIDSHFATKRREHALVEGRRVMLRRLYDTQDAVEETAPDATYKPPQYQITQTPDLLSLLLTDILLEATELKGTHPVSASKLMETLWDLIDLYRAVMPSYHRAQFLGDPTRALVFRNDCHWLASALQYRIGEREEASGWEELPKMLESAVSKLQELGDAWYRIVVSQQLQSIHGLLEHTHGFVGIAENRQHRQDVEQVVAKLVEQMHAFAARVRPLVDRNVFMDLMARLVDGALEKLIQDIENLSDIGAEDSHIIAQNLNSLLQLVSVFDMPDKDATEAFVTDLVPHWHKFWQLNSLLEMNMRDIMDLYRQGGLSMFERSELAGMIRALFADTDLRESNLREIMTSTSRLGDPVLEHSSPKTQAASRPSSMSSAPLFAPTFTPTAASASIPDHAPSSASPVPTTSASVTTPTTTRTSLSFAPEDQGDDDWGWGDADEDINGWDD